jgi:quercetin dioxygenase-like cupin family protein
MYFHDPHDRQSKELIPGLTIRSFWGEKMLASVVHLEPNTLLEEHSHPHEQVSMVLSGEIEFTIAGETKTVKAGELCIIPGDVPHYVKTGAGAVKILDVFSPVREDFKY